MLRIITHETKSKFQLTIGVFSIAFVMLLSKMFTEFLNMLTIKYELAIRMLDKHCCNDFICASLPLVIIYFQNIYYN